MERIELTEEQVREAFKNANSDEVKEMLTALFPAIYRPLNATIFCREKWNCYICTPQNPSLSVLRPARHVLTDVVGLIFLKKLQNNFVD